MITENLLKEGKGKGNMQCMHFKQRSFPFDSTYIFLTSCDLSSYTFVIIHSQLEVISFITLPSSSHHNPLSTSIYSE